MNNFQMTQDSEKFDKKTSLVKSNAQELHNFQQKLIEEEEKKYGVL